MTRIHRKCLAQAVAVGIAVSISAAGYAANQAPQTGEPNKTNSDPQKAPQTLQTIVVTAASLIQRANMHVPTPEVHVSPQVLNVQASINVGQSMKALPYVGNSPTPSTTGGSAALSSDNSGVNLRGMGTAHTLVLLDGQRFLGGQNLNSIPSVLIKGVQVVTGGESATWGSGAVAGVVNISLKHNFQGLLLNGSIGLSRYKDAQGRKFGIAYGAGYANGKGHVELGLNYVSRGPVGPANSLSVRGGEGYSQIVGLPDGKRVMLPGVGFSTAAVGGVITSGVLKGLGFTPQGRLTKLDLGTPVAPGFTVGGKAPSLVDQEPIIPPVNNYVFLARTHYHITDNVQAMAQVRHNAQWAQFTWFDSPVQGMTIHDDNAFLKPSIRNTLLAHGENSFQMGYAYGPSISTRPINIRRSITQATIGLKGVTSNDWHWNAYASYGKTKNHTSIVGWPIEQKWLNALDSVISPVTGAPICRIALTDPTTNCVPINVFGKGNVSQAAKNYMLNPIISNARDELGVVHLEVQGEPFNLPAGPASMAVGADYRHEGTIGRTNKAICEGKMMLLQFCGVSGDFNVKEGFGEILIPLVKHAGILNNFNFDGAVRYSNYSTVGSIWSWKAGFINAFGGGVSLRADFSRDIRAPNIGELFSPSGVGFLTLVDPTTGATAPNVPTATGGNPNLDAEKANTFTVGLIWGPKWAPAFNMSMDYYKIKVKHIITTLGSQTILDECFAGNQSLCDNVIRNPSGQLEEVIANEINVGTLQESGVDVDFAYREPATLFGQSGHVNARVLGTWIGKMQTTQAGVTTHYIGSMLASAFGMPRWKGVGTVGFRSPKFSIHARVRYISRAQFRVYTPIVNNDIPNFYYVDAGASYNFGRHDMMGVYFHALNIFNRLSPPGMFGAFQGHYNLMGAYYILGFRLRLQ